MKAHEVAGLVPAMTASEYEGLREDIRTHGLREPIWVYQGRIIDGRHRWRACEELGVTPETREWDGQGSLVAFVLSLNVERRHLTIGQRAMIGTEVLPRLQEEAKARQMAGIGADGSGVRGTRILRWGAPR